MTKGISSLKATTLTLALATLAGCATHEKNEPQAQVTYPKPNIAPQVANNTPGIAIAQISLPKVSNIDTLYLAPTGTAVGQSVITFHRDSAAAQKEFAATNDEINQLYRKTIQTAHDYHTLLSEIDSRLQMGTTPGNPHLIHLRDQSQMKLTEISDAIGRMNQITSSLQGLEMRLNDLKMQCHSAMQISGAVDQDHANLILLKDELEKLATLSERVMEVTAVNSSRQQNWLTSERQHLSQTSLSIDVGHLESTQGRVMAMPFPMPEPIQAAPLMTLQKPVPHHHPKVVAKSPLPKEEIKSVEAEIKKPEVVAKPKPMVPAPTPAPKAEAKPVVPVAPAPAPKSTPESIKPLEKVEVKPSAPVQKVAPQDEKAPAHPAASSMPLTTAQKDRTPLALVNFDKPKTAYKWYVYSAVSRALETNPKATFDVVVVSSQEKSAADAQKGKDVIATLTDMGIDPSCLRLVEAFDEKATAPQVHIYLNNGNKSSSAETFKFIAPEELQRLSLLGQ